jgi:hypothetical protein
LVAVGRVLTVKVAMPELRVCAAPSAEAPFIKVTEPVVARGLMVAVSNTLLPEAVPAVAEIATPFTVAASVVVVVTVTETLVAGDEVLGS